MQHSINKIKLIYICPEIPYPPNTGGKKAMHNHISSLIESNKYQITLVMFDVDGDRSENIKQYDAPNVQIHYFSRKIKRLGDGLSGVKDAFLAFFSSKPRICKVREHSELLDKVDEIISKSMPDKIILEYLPSFELLPKIYWSKSNVCYICQNIEGKVAYDNAMHKLLSFTGLIYLIEFLKTAHYEKTVLKKIRKTITISSVDENNLKHKYRSMDVINFPEFVPPKKEQWSGLNKKTILFVGASTYYPNKDALIWLVKECFPLIQKMDSDIRLIVCGTKLESIKNNLNGTSLHNIDFRGFVSDSELHKAHIESDLFTCPIILGSGIKLKVLEAASYFMPIAATSEALNGIDFVKIKPVLFRNNALKSASNIVALLNDWPQLNTMSENLKDNVADFIKTRKSFTELIDTNN